MDADVPERLRLCPEGERVSGNSQIGRWARRTALLLLSLLRMGEVSSSYRHLKITIPETLEYDGLFDDLFAKYTTRHELEKVKTTNMGTLYELSYDIYLKDGEVKKEFIDAIRCRNGNLNVSCGRMNDKEML